MRTLCILLGILLYSACIAKEFNATITVYWSNGNGTDSWSRRHLSASGERLREGVSVAVDPDVIPYGSIIWIEGIGKRVAHDTGSAVVSRTASRRRGVSYPVIDVYFDDKDDALDFAREHTYAKVKIIRNAS